MNHQRKSTAQAKKRGPIPAVSAPAQRPSRWPLIVTVLVGVAVGAAILERFTRPAGTPNLAENAPPAEPAGRAGSRDLRPPAPVTATTVELVAEGKQLADELAESFADVPEALALSGRLSFTLGSSAKATQRWEQSLKLSPQSAEAWLGMAELAWEKGDFQEAVRCMRRLAEGSPGLAEEKTFILADSLLGLGSAREAVEVLESAGKKAPLPSWAQVMLGQGYLQLKDFGRAEKEYRKALEGHPQLSSAHYGLSVALMRLGRREEAQKHREEYARWNKQDMVAFDRMRGHGTQKERHSEADLLPILARFHVEAGRFYAMRGQPDQAQKHWLRAWAMVPDRPEPRQLLESLELQ